MVLPSPLWCILYCLCLTAVLSLEQPTIELDSERDLRGNKRDEDALLFTREDVVRTVDATNNDKANVNIPAQKKRLRRFQRRWSKLGRMDYSFQYREKDGLYTVKVLNGTGQNANPVIMDDLFEWIRESLRQGDNLETYRVRFDQRGFYPSFFDSVYFDEEMQATTRKWFRISGVQSPPQTPQGYARTELTKARARWLSKNIKSYRFNSTTVVQNGTAAEAHSNDPDCVRSQIRTVFNTETELPVLFGDDLTERVKPECGPFSTVVELFDAIDAELDAGMEVDAVYKKRTGAPFSIKVYDSEEREEIVSLRKNGITGSLKPRRLTQIHQLARLRKARCPVKQPATNDECNVNGLDCVYGETECCGRSYVQTICSCADGKFSCGPARGDCPAVCPSL